MAGSTPESRITPVSYICVIIGSLRADCSAAVAAVADVGVGGSGVRTVTNATDGAAVASGVVVVDNARLAAAEAAAAVLAAVFNAAECASPHVGTAAATADTITAIFWVGSWRVR